MKLFKIISRENKKKPLVDVYLRLETWYFYNTIIFATASVNCIIKTVVVVFEKRIRNNFLRLLGRIWKKMELGHQLSLINAKKLERSDY